MTNHKTILVKLVIRAKQIVQNTNDKEKKEELETEVRIITKDYDNDDEGNLYTVIHRDHFTRRKNDKKQTTCLYFHNSLQ